MRVVIPVSCGELIDRITILQIKSGRIHDVAKLANVNNELRMLRTSFAVLLGDLSDDAEKAMADLLCVNQEIWDDEERLRLTNVEGYIADISVRIFQNNDRRHAIKRRLDELMCSDIIEEKSYQ